MSPWHHSFGHCPELRALCQGRNIKQLVYQQLCFPSNVGLNAGLRHFCVSFICVHLGGFILLLYIVYGCLTCKEKNILPLAFGYAHLPLCVNVNIRQMGFLLRVCRNMFLSFSIQPASPQNLKENICSYLRGWHLHLLPQDCVGGIRFSVAW